MTGARAGDYTNMYMVSMVRSPGMVVRTHVSQRARTGPRRTQKLSGGHPSSPARTGYGSVEIFTLCR